MTSLRKARALEVPELPESLKRFEVMTVRDKSPVKAEVLAYFPYLSQVDAQNEMTDEIADEILKVGVILSGGQAAGGHNVIIALLEGLKKLNEQSTLIGFLNGPSGIVNNHYKELDKEFLASFLNTGGFDMIGSGRTKIETDEQFGKALETVKKHGLNALVVIGGDDSNTNAALLAEYFLSKNQPTTVIGVPKTIDGDLKNEYIEVSFGFDTATKTYAELVGNVLIDALSAKKYWFFVRLMGRSASHISLEVAHKTHPNLTLISEERRELSDIVKEIASLVRKRASMGKSYGLVLVPEGLIEFLPEMPAEFLAGMPVSYDSHGNLEMSKLETEKLLIELVRKELQNEVIFNPQALFFGYEGRSAYPSYFDATYTYALGYTAAILCAKKRTGQMATISHLSESVFNWKGKGVPLLSMIVLEERKGKLKPVIQKTLVDLKSPFYQSFKKKSEEWRIPDDYRSPGPIQFWGPKEIVRGIPDSIIRGINS